VVELATSNGTINRENGTNKNTVGVLGFATQVDQTRGLNPQQWVGWGVIASRYSDNTIWSRSWLDTAVMLVNYGKTCLGRNFGMIFSDYK
jgi:hypothetical protein